MVVVVVTYDIDITKEHYQCYMFMNVIWFRHVKTIFFLFEATVAAMYDFDRIIH